MARIVGFFNDAKQAGLAESDLESQGFTVEIIKKSQLSSLGLPEETKPLYKGLAESGGVLLSAQGRGGADGIREIFEIHGASQIRTV